MRDRLEELAEEGLAALGSAATEEDLRRVEQDYLGRHGRITAVLRQLGGLPPAERPAVGRLANEIKERLARELEARLEILRRSRLEAELAGEGFDPTLPGPPARAGSLHPIERVRRELEDLFRSMGYAVAGGPEVETEEHNFDALNIPPDHPAREGHDTLWIEGGDRERLCMRTHTSPVQVRALRRHGVPLRVVAPGRVFRQETQDATHDHTFHQMEGLVVDRGVGVPHMLHAMRSLLSGLFGRELQTRLRPGYFPFVEPGFELDARCPFCKSGCSVCKGSTWIELMPGGLVHPEVLRASGVDPEDYSGFAFGLGLSRIAMLRYGIDDIRWMMSGDLRFLEQFDA